MWIPLSWCGTTSTWRWSDVLDGLDADGAQEEAVREGALVGGARAVRGAVGWVWWFEAVPRDVLVGGRRAVRAAVLVVRCERLARGQARRVAVGEALRA